MATILTLTDLSTDPDRLLTAEQAAPFRGGSPATMARDRWAGTGIPYIKLGRQPWYRAGDVLAWVSARRVQPQQVA